MATTVNPRNFPGVYTQIVDESFVQPAISRFRPGLIGVATKGAFNTPTAVRSLREFTRFFGTPLTTTYETDGEPSGRGFFLADAIAIISDLTDGAVVVRVGNEYSTLPTADGSGLAGSYNFGTTNASIIQSLLSGLETDQDVYVRLTEAGKASTVNARVISAGGGTVSLSTTTDSLQAGYNGASVAYSLYQNAANKAEGLLYGYTYGLTSAGTVDAAITSVGTVTGTKNQFQFAVQNNPGDVEVGSIYKIEETAKNTTHEVRVARKEGNTMYLDTSDFTRIGYQALPLQDSYESGTLYKVTGSIPLMWLEAASEGTWANGATPTVGLFVRVRPGSAAGTKKWEIYEDGALVETFDDLSDDPTSDDYYTTRINGSNNEGISQYVRIKNVYSDSSGSGQLYHTANTANPWDSNYVTANLSLTPKTMPEGRLNAGYTGSGSAFDEGFNGENAQDTDFVGTYDATTDTLTGLKAFEDQDNINVNILAAPMDDISRSVMQELNRVAKKINAVAIADVPAGLNPYQAVDWHNGAGQFTGLGRIDSPNLAVYWNWFNMVDPFTSVTKLVPPTLGTLRAMAFTFDRDFPWYAAAGETRGVIPEALTLEYPRVSQDAREAMYGNGQSVNPILRIRGRHVLFGERTMQVAESKLSAVHSMVLVNYIVNGLAEIGRRYVFDPNDAELLAQIRLSFTEFLDKVANERGLEDYELVVDDRNNNADTRNLRQVIVDLAVVPTDVAERIFINATVKESGADLNEVVA